MRRSLIVAALIAGLVISSAATFAFIEIGLLARDAHQKLAGAAIKLNVISAQLQSVLQSVQAVELNTTRTEAELAGLANQTRHLSMQTAKAELDLVARAGIVLDSANVAVIKLGDAAQSLGTVGPTVSDAIKQLQVDTHATLENSQVLLAAATTDLDDPAIHEIMLNLQATSKESMETAENVDATTRDIKAYVHRMTTPARGTWNFIKGLLNLTYQSRGAIGK